MRVTNKQWIKLIGGWMGENGRATLAWKDVLGLEGGYGADKIKSVEDAKKPENEGTWPGIWFQSDQKDFSVYKRYDYVYSLLFGRTISAGSFAIVAKDLAEKHQRAISVVDWGGTIFTAVELLDKLPKGSRVEIVNLPSPQVEFAKWARDKLEIDSELLVVATEGEILEPDESLHEGPIVLSETLEHIQEPVAYIVDTIGRVAWLNDIYTASSFCTPAYGHPIPININGVACHTPRQANKQFKHSMELLGFSGTRLPGWNSRVWRWTR